MDAHRSPRVERSTLGSIVSLMVTLWTLVSSCCRVLVLLLLRFLLRGVNHANLSAAFREVGLSAVLAEGETPHYFENVVARKEGPDLLPPQRTDQKARLTVVLDLDETLVCAYHSALLPAELEQVASRGVVTTFTMPCRGSETDVGGAVRGAHVTVFLRPGLSEFLDRVSQFSELVLFTAGQEGYANPVIDRIDPQGRITHRLYRPATVSTPLRDHVKDLGLLGRNLARCVLVDNNPFSFLLQPCNGIPCMPFTGRHPDDRHLLDVLLPLLQQLAEEADIRPSLLRHYQMPAWFQTRGVPLHQEH